MLAKNAELRARLSGRGIYILPAFTKEESMKENLCLKKRRELLEAGTPTSTLKTYNFEFFKDDQKVELETAITA